MSSRLCRLTFGVVKEVTDMFPAIADFNEVRMTSHAERRARQRGIQQQCIDLVLSHADVVRNAGAQCETWRLSRRAADELHTYGFPASVIARARQLALVVAEGSRVATVLHLNRGRRGRCYRRQMPTYAYDR